MRNLLGRMARSLSLVILAVIATSAMVYAAPGYFSDQREMDAAHSATAVQELTLMHREQGSLWSLLAMQYRHLLHGDLGTSRQLNQPVADLLLQSLPPSARLLAQAIVLGWGAALLLSLLFSLPVARSLDALLAMGTALSLGIPIGALATLCLLANHDTPVLVLALVIGVRDFKILHRIFQNTWHSPCLLFARAQGFGTSLMIRAHVLPTLQREILSVAVVSLTLALSALVPVEVIFDRSGIGKLAWSAAMNRDLPVLVATTALVAACVGLANTLSSFLSKGQTEPCAE